jgi:excisionase family DNA binding protein
MSPIVSPELKALAQFPIEADLTRPEFYTGDELAHILKVSKRHLYRLVDRGAAPQPTRLGASVRWHRETVLKWIAAGCPSVRQGKGGRA